MVARLLVAAIAIVLIQGVVMLIRANRQPASIRPPAQDLANLPLQFAGWTGKDSPIDPQLSSAIGASQVIDRVYSDETGAKLMVEVASFETDELAPPHSPQSCYRNVGWTLKQQKNVELKVLGGPPRRARILTFEQEAQRVHVLYWYQLGDAHVVDYNSLRSERSNLFGQSVWPPLLKVMIQSAVADAALAEDQLLSFGETLLAWSKNL